MAIGQQEKTKGLKRYREFGNLGRIVGRGRRKEVDGGGRREVERVDCETERIL